YTTLFRSVRFDMPRHKVSGPQMTEKRHEVLFDPAHALGQTALLVKPVGIKQASSGRPTLRRSAKVAIAQALKGINQPFPALLSGAPTGEDLELHFGARA